MSKLNMSIATALAAAAVATVSAAQVPSGHSATPRGGAAQQSDVALNPGASSAQPAIESGPLERSAPVAQPAAGAPVVAPGVSAPASSSAPATQAEWIHAAPPTAVPVREQHYGNVSTSGEVRVGSEPQTPGKTYAHRFSATVDVANVSWRSGRGYDLFSERDASWRLGLGIGYDVLRLPENLVFVVEAGVLHEPAHGGNLNPLFGRLSGSLSATTVHLGPSLRWAPTPWLAPYARLGLLASSFSMEIDAASASTWNYQKWAGGTFMGAGVMLTLPPSNPVNLGLLIEGGYWLQRDVPIQLERELPRDAIATSSARVGTLENTGPYLRIAGVLRF